MKADGLSLDDKRQPVSENDIPDIISVSTIGGRKRSNQSFFVDVKDIIANDYDLRYCSMRIIRELINPEHGAFWRIRRSRRNGM